MEAESQRPKWSFYNVDEDDQKEVRDFLTSVVNCHAASYVASCGPARICADTPGD